MTAVPPPPAHDELQPGLPPRETAFAISVPPKVRWGLPDAAVAIALAPLSIGLGFALQALGVRGWVPPILLSFGGYAAIVVALVVITLRRGQGGFAIDYGFRLRPVDLAIGLGIAVLARIFGIIFALTATLVTGAPPKSSNVEFGTDPVVILLFGLLLGTLIAPIVEELVTRGLLMRAVRYAILRGPRAAPRPQPAPAPTQRTAALVALAVSSLVFMGLHLYQAPGDPALFISLALTTFTTGALHGVITLVTGRLGAAMVSHVIFNGSALLITVLLPQPEITTLFGVML